MNNWQIISGFVLGWLMFSAGMIILFQGMELYDDASLLWASGILTYLGIQGIVNFVAAAFRR